MVDIESIIEDLDSLCMAARKVMSTRIDANACGGRNDFKNMHYAEEEFDDKYTLFERRLRNLCESDAKKENLIASLKRAILDAVSSHTIGAK